MYVHYVHVATCIIHVHTSRPCLQLYLVFPGVESEGVASNGQLVVDFLCHLNLSHHWLHLHAHIRTCTHTGIYVTYFGYEYIHVSNRYIAMITNLYIHCIYMYMYYWHMQNVLHIMIQYTGQWHMHHNECELTGRIFKEEHSLYTVKHIRTCTCTCTVQCDMYMYWFQKFIHDFLTTRITWFCNWLYRQCGTCTCTVVSTLTE